MSLVCRSSWDPKDREASTQVVCVDFRMTALVLAKRNWKKRKEIKNDGSQQHIIMVFGVGNGICHCWSMHGAGSPHLGRDQVLLSGADANTLSLHQCARELICFLCSCFVFECRMPDMSAQKKRHLRTRNAEDEEKCGAPKKSFRFHRYGIASLSLTDRTCKS